MYPGAYLHNPQHSDSWRHALGELLRHPGPEVPQKTKSRNMEKAKESSGALVSPIPYLLVTISSADVDRP